MAVAGCINAYDCAGCYLTTLQQLQSDNIGVAINYTAPWEYWRRQLDYIKYTDKCGCTCCLTGENELRIVATQWVIKNFTLTNDDTNEVVNVKWNDLFGSNRAYTMVRYKTGSYPTSITDWTLAVKETTQNQYSVSWYNVSGLTDWTTYYFTAFAVSQDGTIIVVQSWTITTEFSTYIVNVNTRYYLNLDQSTWTFIDKSTYNHTTTNNWIQYNANWIIKWCWYNNQNLKKIISWMNSWETFPTNFTIMCFCKPTWNSRSTDHPMMIAYSNASSKVVRWIWFNQTNSQVYFNHLLENVRRDTSSVSFSALNSRHHYALTFNWTTMIWYIDAVQKISANVSWSWTWTTTPTAWFTLFWRYITWKESDSSLSNVIQWYVDEAICEDRTRTQAEIQTYLQKVWFIS